MGSDNSPPKDLLLSVVKWVQSRSAREKTVLGAMGAVLVRGRRVACCSPCACLVKPALLPWRWQEQGAPLTPHHPRPLCARSKSHKHARTRAQLLLLLWATIEDHDVLFVLAELAHFLGIGVLAYKIHRRKSVAGASCACMLACAHAGVHTRTPA